MLFPGRNAAEDRFKAREQFPLIEWFGQIIIRAELQSHSHGQSEAVFGLAYLLGVELMPRIKNWKRLTFCRPVPPGSAPFTISILAISVLPLNSARDRAVNLCCSFI